MWKLREFTKSFVDRHTLLNAGDISTWRWRLARYAVAVAVTLLAWAASLGLQFEVGGPNISPFAAAVAIAAWYGGTGPGLLTGALSIIAIDFSFLPPIGSIELTHSEDV